MNLGRKWAETEDRGKSSCEKLRVVLAVLLVVAVCQSTPLRIIINEHAEHKKFGPPEHIWTLRSVGPQPAPGWGPTELPINHPWWSLS